MKSNENIPKSMSAVALHTVGKARTSGGWRGGVGYGNLSSGDEVKYAN